MHLFATWLSSGLLAWMPALDSAAPVAPAFEAAVDGHDDEAESGTIFLRAGRVIVRPGRVLENAQVLVEDGVIVAVGTDLEKPEGAQEISGAVVCAGFIDPWSTFGLAGDSVADDRTDAGTRSIDAIDVFGGDHLRLQTLEAGVTTVRSQAGDRSRVGGVGAIVRLADAHTRDDAVVLEDAVLATSVGLSRGSTVRDVFDRVSDLDSLASDLEGGRKYLEDKTEAAHELAEWEKEIAEKEKELEKDFKKAKKDRDKKKEEAKEKDKEFKEKRYKEDKKPSLPKFDEKKEVFARVANGELPLVVQAHRSAEIRGLLDLIEPFDRVRLVLAGGTESVRHAEELAARRIPVIVWPAPLGTAKYDELDGHELSLAAQLADAGVGVLIGSGGSQAHSRDLPLFAALAVGHGLDREDAFAAITLDAARAFDVADRLGSVERGKDADLLVLDGPPLVSTSRVQYVVVGGRVAITPED